MSKRSSDASDDGPADYLLLHTKLKVRDGPIWRQFLVPPHLTLDNVHILLQCAFGWSGGHMHKFEVCPAKEKKQAKGVTPIVTRRNPAGYMVPNLVIDHNPVYTIFESQREARDYDWLGPEELGLESKVAIGDLVDRWDIKKNKHALKYIYDLSDEWDHTIMFEKAIPRSDCRHIGKNYVTGGEGQIAEEEWGVAPKFKITAANKRYAANTKVTWIMCHDGSSEDPNEVLREMEHGRWDDNDSDIHDEKDDVLGEYDEETLDEDEEDDEEEDEDAAAA